MYAGKKKWEGAKDTSLIDYIKKELGHSYRHLCTLLLLLKGDRAEDEAADEEGSPAARRSRCTPSARRASSRTLTRA